MCLCYDRNVNNVNTIGKMRNSNTRRSRVFSGIFPVEMASFMFLSQCIDTKAILDLFYKVTRGVSSFRDVSCASVLGGKMRFVQSSAHIEPVLFSKCP